MAVHPIDSEPSALSTESRQALHTLAIRVSVDRLPPSCEGLLAAGLVQSTHHGFQLTLLGYRSHRAMLEAERANLDLNALNLTYAPVPALGRRLRALCSGWEKSAGKLDRRRLAADFCGFVETTEPTLQRIAALCPRFATYLPRMNHATGRLRAGRYEYALGAEVDSIDVIWRDLHEDLLQTLGRAHDQGYL